MTKELFGGLAVVCGLIAYIPYVRSILRGKTKPHAFSWFVWSLILVTAFGVQFSAGAGPGAWYPASGMLMCVAIFLYALIKGDRAYSVIDWLALVGAITAFVLWQVTKDPTLAAIFVTAADAISYIPTLRKTYLHPEQESLRAFSIWWVGAILSILALQTYSLATWLYPLSAVIMNPIVIALALRRRSTATQTTR